VRVRTFTGGGFGENAYLAVCETTAQAVVIDPGADAPRMAAAITAEGVDLRAILLTHAHIDPVEGVPDIRSAAPDVPIWIHPDALGMYRAMPHQAARFGMELPDAPEPTDELVPGDTFDFGDCSLEVRFTPGHAPGHVTLYDAEAGIAFVGDVVFHGSIGRTDLPGGDLQTLMKSIRKEILTLPDETVLYSGHGPATTVAVERVGNPFLIPHYGGELA
jgi:glyoxylase-like metal-dependent hydrolase (beta-lactamase superfamily II)